MTSRLSTVSLKRLDSHLSRLLYTDQKPVPVQSPRAEKEKPDVEYHVNRLVEQTGVPESIVQQSLLVFRHFDPDGEEFLPRHDLKNALFAVGLVNIKENDLELTSDRFGVDQNGVITVETFLRIFRHFKSESIPASKANVIGAFIALGGNLDTSGTVDAARLKAFVERFELHINVEAWMDQLDTNHDGNLDFKEFEQFLDDL